MKKTFKLTKTQRKYIEWLIKVGDIKSEYHLPMEHPILMNYQIEIIKDILTDGEYDAFDCKMFEAIKKEWGSKIHKHYKTEITTRTGI